MNLSWFEFFLFGLATFRLTRLMISDTITAFIRKPFHDVVEKTLPDGTTEVYLNIKGKGLRRWIGELLSCYWCTGIWSSIFLFGFYYYIPQLVEPLIVILAIAGLAAIIETAVIKLMD